jgi:hypothetical protein
LKNWRTTGRLANRFKLRQDSKVFLLLFLQKKKNICSFLKKRTKKLLFPAQALARPKQTFP